jgi:muramidase (phage lysozyme)
MSINLRAFLYLIRHCEGTAGENGYRTLFGGELFDSFADHPRRAITKSLGGKPLTSTAAGGYQFLARTWDECAKALHLPDFSPESQDRAAIFLIKRRGALGDVEAGRIEAAIKKCNREWASLPGSPYGQPVKTLAECLAVYHRAGGAFAAAPVTEEKPMAPIIAAVLPSLLSAAPDLLKIFKDRGQESSKQYAEAAERVVKAAVEVTGAVNAQEAAERVRNDPAAAEALRAAVKDRWFELAQASEENIATARKFAVDYSRDRPVAGKFNFIELLSLVFVAVSSAGGGWVLVGEFPPEMKGAVITLMLIAGFTGVKEFWFGSSRGSDRKTEILGDR